MVYGLRYFLKDNKFVATPSKHHLHGNVEDVIEHVRENYLQTISPLFIMKNADTSDLMKLELVEGKVNISYIFDFFDFEKEFDKLN